MLTLIPVPKNPHGINVTPDGRYAIAAGKLSPTVTIIDAHTLKIVAEPEVGLGPLHTTFDDRGNAFTSLFLDSQVVKWNIDKAVKGASDYIVDRINVHYNIGHLQAVGGDHMHPAGDYLIALNKLSKDMYVPVGPDLPENQEIIDISGEKMKLLASFPTPPEPHDATFMAVSVLKPLVHQTYTPADDAVKAGKERVVRTAPHAVTVDMTLIRSAYTPDSFQVREGDQVTLKITNVETIRDMIHGFALPDHNLNIALAPGLHEDDHVRRRQAGRLLVLLHELLQRAASRDARADGGAAERRRRHADRLARRGERERAGRPRRAVDGRPEMKAPAMYLAAAAFAAAALVLPLWGFSMSAPQYPDETLHLRVQRSGIVGDVHEVETLQHYIGVRFPTDMPELKWATRAIVAVALLLLVAAFVGDWSRRPCVSRALRRRGGDVSRRIGCRCAGAAVPGRPRAGSAFTAAGHARFHAAAGRSGQGR